MNFTSATPSIMVDLPALHGNHIKSAKECFDFTVRFIGEAVLFIAPDTSDQSVDVINALITLQKRYNQKRWGALSPHPSESYNSFKIF